MELCRIYRWLDTAEQTDTGYAQPRLKWPVLAVSDKVWLPSACDLSGVVWWYLFGYIMRCLSRQLSVVDCCWLVVDVPRRRKTLLPVNGSVDADKDVNSVRGLVEPSLSNDDASHSVGVVLLGATLGVATVLAALLIAVVVCFVAATRRRRAKRLTKRADDVTRPLPLPPITGRAPGNHYVSTSSLQVRATTAQQPVPPTRKDSRASSVQSPKPCRATATLPARTCPSDTTFHTMMTPATAADVDDARYLAQRRAAWDAILERQGIITEHQLMAQPTAGTTLLSAGVPEPVDRPLSMSELPPPPDFLLENAGPEVHLAAGKVFDGRTACPLMLEAGEGYRSADSVDDDIDDIDLTIRHLHYTAPWRHRPVT